MTRLPLILALLAGCASLTTDSPVRIVDADTFYYGDVKYRLLGWDGPEKDRDHTPWDDTHSGAQCQQELDLSKLAIAYAESLIESADRVELVVTGEDCAHNRPCGDLDLDGRSYIEDMRAAGYLRRWDYDGGQERPDWCGG